MFRAVIDTNVVVSAALSPGGTPARLLQSAGKLFQIVWSAGIVAECLRVLTYEKVARRLRAVGREEGAVALVARLAAGADMVAEEALPAIRVVEGDPTDDLLVATALGGGATLLVSGDKRHLLDSGLLAGIRVIDPGTFAWELGLSELPARRGPGSVHEPVAPYGDGMLLLAIEAQRWARARARRSNATRR